MTQQPEDHNQGFEDALKILARMEQAGRPDPDYVAIAQVHATLALVREQQSTNRILRRMLDYMGAERRGDAVG